jgi:hypothetical protein
MEHKWYAFEVCIERNHLFPPDVKKKKEAELEKKKEEAVSAGRHETVLVHATSPWRPRFYDPNKLVQGCHIS